MKKTSFRKTVVFLLTVCMLLSMLPNTVIATNEMENLDLMMMGPVEYVDPWGPGEDLDKPEGTRDDDQSSIFGQLEPDNSGAGQSEEKLPAAGVQGIAGAFAKLAMENILQIIDPDGETIVEEYSNLADALTAVNNGQIIKLLADIEYNAGIVVTDLTFTFDVNGKTLKVVNASGHGLEVGSGGEVLLADSASGGKLNVWGGGNRDYHGVYAHSGGKATVTTPNTTASTTTSRCAYAKDSGTSVTIMGNALANAGMAFYPIEVTSGASMKVYGNINGGGAMVVDGIGTNVHIVGNTSGGGTGVLATNGATVKVDGNVRSIGSYGVLANTGAQVTIDGKVTIDSGKTYVYIDGKHKNQENHELTSSKPGYFEYKNDTTNVWVKDPTPLIKITTPPEDITVIEDDITESLTCVATVSNGATPGYQWYSNTTKSNEGGALIGSATSGTFKLSTALKAEDSPYYYYCVVTADGANPVVSEAVTVTVKIGDYAVRHKETGKLYETLSDGLAGAKKLGYSTFTLEVFKSFTEKGSVIIDSERVTIVGSGGEHTVTWANTSPPGSSYRFALEGGGSLTLGDGTKTNTLTIDYTVRVTDGKINVKDGVTIKRESGGYSVFMSGPNATGTISGGNFHGAYGGLSLEKGATIDMISGGEFRGSQEAVYLTGVDTKIMEISGGSYYQYNPEEKLHGQALFVQNKAQIGKISGGYFEAVRHSAVMLVRGAWIDEISGGVFVATKTGTVANEDRVATMWIEGAEISTAVGTINTTGVGIISGGHFSGTNFGILLIRREAKQIARIDTITGGTFMGSVGLQIDVDTSVGEIIGGKFASSGQGIFNVGLIGKIGGQAEITSRTSSGITNWDSRGRINEISGGLIVGETTVGISNKGTITLISGGTIKGQQAAINCTDTGTIGKITNGVFWGTDYAAIYLVKQVILEPDLNTKKGLGRYWGKNGVIFNNEALVKYPTNYHMSTQTESVAGIHDAKFKYLTLEGYYEYTVTVEDSYAGSEESGAGTYEKGDQVKLNAGTRDGYTFTEWTTEDGVIFADEKNSKTTFTMPEKDITVTANWKQNEYTVTVEDSYAEPEETGAGIYKKGEQVKLNAGTRNGYTFTKWTTEDGVIFADEKNSKTTFTMPEKDVTVTANWIKNSGSTPEGPGDTPKPITVNLEAKKTVTGDGAALTAGQFSFTVYDGNTVVATATNDGTGNINFPAIKYTQAGTHTYKITEASADGNGWTTDKNSYTATVTVTKKDGVLSATVAYQDGTVPTFTNRYVQVEQEAPDKQEAITFNISKALVDKTGKRIENEENFWVVLYEKKGADWDRLGEYTIAPNGKATAIANLERGKTYQLVEKTGNWYKTLGFKVMDGYEEVGSSKGESVAIAIPPQGKNKSIEIVVKNELTDGQPNGQYGGGEPELDPPLIEIEEWMPPMSPFIAEHLAYVVGYPDGNVGPGRDITRAEVATIFFRLLTEEIRSDYWTQQNTFPDVKAENWHNNAVSVMNRMSIVKGYPDGRFVPDGAITRGELAALTVRFAKAMGMTPAKGLHFSDLAGHWAKDDIQYATAIGWVNGYPDGTFRPDQPITRAEVMTLVNRMLERIPETENDLVDGMLTWKDNTDPQAWFYLAVQEATNSHEPEYKGTDKMIPGLQFAYEFWISLLENLDWTSKEK